MTPKRKVFISYARKDSTSAQVGKLVGWLKEQEGVDVISDHDYPLKAPGQGWYAWMEHSIAAADIVLCICGKQFKKGFEKRGGPSGVAYEGDIITADLYEKCGWNEKFHPILPKAGAHAHVPKKLQPWDNNIALAQRERILALIREGQHPLPPPPPGTSSGSGGRPPPLTTKRTSRLWQLMTPTSVFVAVLGVFAVNALLKSSGLSILSSSTVTLESSTVASTVKVLPDEQVPPVGEVPTVIPGSSDAGPPPPTHETDSGATVPPAVPPLVQTPPEIQPPTPPGQPSKTVAPASKPKGLKGNSGKQQEDSRPAGNDGKTDDSPPKEGEATGSAVNPVPPAEPAKTPVKFHFPRSIAVDGAGNLYVVDSNGVFRVTPSGSVLKLVGKTEWGHPTEITIGPGDNLYMTVGHRICEVLWVGNSITTLAGNEVSGFANGTRDARFHSPRGIAVDKWGNLYVADERNHSIRKVTPSGHVGTLAGGIAGFAEADGIAGFADGDATNARFYFPGKIAVDRAGNLYVADRGNHRIRKLTPSGMVSTLAGSIAGFVDGSRSVAMFNQPRGIAVDAEGNLYVADTMNHRIRKVTPSGVVSTLAGSTKGSADGIGSAAQFNEPHGIAVDAAGNLYVADNGNGHIRKLNVHLREVSTLQQ